MKAQETKPRVFFLLFHLFQLCNLVAVASLGIHICVEWLLSIVFIFLIVIIAKQRETKIVS